MGEARRRGTYEERKAAAIKEREEGERLLSKVKADRKQYEKNKIQTMMDELSK